MAKLKADLESKDKETKVLQEKVKQLEKEKRSLKKELDDHKKDVKELQANYTESNENLSEVTNENTELRDQIKLLNSHGVANEDILEKYNEVKKKYEELLENKKSPEAASIDNENDNIEVLVINKQRGGRRDNPAVPTPLVPTEDKLHKCTWCQFRSVDKARLKNHIKEKHQQCDICEVAFKTPVSLREHMRNRHDKQNGTTIICEQCNFSALNQVHLRKHTVKHHSERKCNQCDFKTTSEHAMETHTSKQHTTKKQVTCRYWRRNGSCRYQDSCSFVHQIIPCRYGDRCTRGNSCRFGHENVEPVKERQNISPWINPAFVSNGPYEKEFPFLGRAPGQCLNQCCKVRGMGF